MGIGFLQNQRMMPTCAALPVPLYPILLLKCIMVELSGGSDGARTVTYCLSALNLYERQEIVDPLLSAKFWQQDRRSIHTTHIPEREWSEVAQRYDNSESLRQLARAYGVSHESIRQVIKKYNSS
jgi:hypothetical protein